MKRIILYFFALYTIASFGQSEITDLVKLTNPKEHKSDKVLMTDENGNLGFLPITDTPFGANSSNITSIPQKTEFTEIPKFKNLPELKSQKVIVLDNEGNLGYVTVSDLKKPSPCNACNASGARGLEAKGIKLNLSNLPDKSTAYNYVVVLGDDNVLGKRSLAELTGAMNDWTFLTIRYTWDLDDGGKDLDIAVGLCNTNISAINNQCVGYRGGHTETTSKGVYLEWAGDNTGDGGESVLFDPEKLYQAYPNLDDTIELYVTCVWWNTKNKGNVKVELIAYKNGEMEKNGYIYENKNGGREVGRQTIVKNISDTNRDHLYDNQYCGSTASRIGKIIYTNSTRSAKFVKL